MSDKRPIAVFDSGLGGLTVVKALHTHLPNENIIYFGDTARVPYGNKSQDLIQKYSAEIAKFLIQKDAKLIIVACNTATALALDYLKEKFDTPIIGVIDPGAEAAQTITKNKKIGIIGTLATIRSGAYEKALSQLDSAFQSFSKPCPLFVPLIEEGWITGDVPAQVANTYLSELIQNKIDTLILGCTHYPLLEPILTDIVGDNIQIVDSAETTAIYARHQLESRQLLNNENEIGKLENYVTDLPVRFKRVARQFLGREIDHVSSVHLS